MVKREQSFKITITGETLSLEDLRWIVSQAARFKGESKVEVTSYSEQRDGSYYAIVVHGDPEDIKPTTCRTYGTTGGSTIGTTGGSTITWNQEKR